MRSIIEKGNIERYNYPGLENTKADDYVNLYMGSGSFGGSFDALGVMNRTYSHWARHQGHTGSNTVFMHADHWSRGNHGMDFHLPVARLVWASTYTVKENSYKQSLNIYDGILRTEFTAQNTDFKLASYFNPYNRDIFAMEIEYNSKSETSPILHIAPITNVSTQYDNDFIGCIVSQETDQEKALSLCRISVGTADTLLLTRIITEKGQAKLLQSEEGLDIEFTGAQGKHLVLLGVSSYERGKELIKCVEKIRNSRSYARESSEAWHQRWGSSWLEIPDNDIQKMWCRSLYYTLCSYSPDSNCIGPAMGWSGNSWNFHFPQDVSYIFPALLKLGHVDIAKAKVEFYRNCLESTKRNTKRIYGYEGAMWAWEHPIGCDFNILEGEIFNWFMYEVHNAAYPARMAYETSLYVKSKDWTIRVAWPIVEASARFYGDSLKRDKTGRWNLKIEPSFGQDEAGGKNATNYLCALFSAKYCLQTALKLIDYLEINSDEYDKWRRILIDGLAFNKLYDSHMNLYYTCEEAMMSELKQKHPVQLNPLIFLPLQTLDEPTVIAYKHRYDLCLGVKNNVSLGWTLGAYWLAASHMRDGITLMKELKQIRPMNLADEELIQFFESSSTYMNQYYTTTHGLLLQALNDAFVSDYWGSLELCAACPPNWESVRFSRFHTIDGRIVSGHLDDGTWDIKIEHE